MWFDWPAAGGTLAMFAMSCCSLAAGAGDSWSSGYRDRSEVGSLVLCLLSLHHGASSKVTFLPVF